MYYLNAFNEMLRKRQRQNMMGGEGVGNAPPSGPMGASQSGGGMSGVRNFLNDPLVNIFAAATPFRAPFALAKLASSAYDDSQRASENAAMEAARQGFQAREKADYGPPGPEYGPAPTGDVFQNAYEGGMETNSFNAANMGGSASYNYGDFGDTAMAAPVSVVGGPMGQTGITGTDLESFGALGGGFAGADYGGGLGGFGSSSNEGVGIGERGDLARGGLVTPEHLHGPNPPGEDDGYTALKRGEYVITKAAVEKYGKRLLDAINNGTFR